MSFGRPGSEVEGLRGPRKCIGPSRQTALESHKDTLHFVPGALEMQQDPGKNIRDERPTFATLRGPWKDTRTGNQAGGQARESPLASLQGQEGRARPAWRENLNMAWHGRPLQRRPGRQLPTKYVGQARPVGARIPCAGG